MIGVYYVYHLMKEILHQNHIEHRPSGNAQQRIPFPFMEQKNKTDGDCLRQPVISGKYRVFQAVNH